MPFGAQLQGDGRTRFRLWAPSWPEVTLELGEGRAARRVPMQPLADGWHQAVLADAGPGTRYHYVLGSGLRMPDPASRFNPGDTDGPSLVIDPSAYRWQDDAWRGRPWHEAVIYELHLGTFTPEGSFAAAARRLPELAGLGITAIELMPVTDFPGRRGWGYDGVLAYAPEATYGTPDDFKSLVDEAHAHGLMVLLDVVYNHFGPEGNHLHAGCPQFFSAQAHTPWGPAINFDGPHSATVREFFVHNALYWVEEFHLDGLRLDAVHAIHDGSPRHIVCEIAQALRAGPGARRHVHLVVENDANRASLLARGPAGQALCATAQWNDDLHHAAHVLLTGETDGYYRDYADQPAARLARALAQGFVYQGQASAFRGGVPRGEPSAHLPPCAFVSFLQNHDQIGNRAHGERLSHLADAARLDALYACLLLSAHVPMLFMGEEYAASTPFLFFCHFGPELAQAVRQGRREEFARFAAFADPLARERIPDPNDEATFGASVLRWDEREHGPHAERLALVRRLLALRHEYLLPRLPMAPGGATYRTHDGLLRVSWPLADGSTWHLAANLGRSAVTGVAAPEGQHVYAARLELPAGTTWPPDAVLVTLQPRDA